MKKAVETFPDIFAAFGGTSAMARALGLKQSAASEMKRRRSVPYDYWPRLIIELNKVGYRATPAQLINIHLAERGIEERVQ